MAQQQHFLVSVGVSKRAGLVETADIKARRTKS